ncbi:pilus assembly protein TadB [Crossiella cryophila]|uniref:Flp pilus assembly protein TadB n=1 Tax=Crossiella cryophila TaxID=43355 RepID=A0A7W7FVY9_9PSEU|nr:pilus assembly protein TadB [Crossiella cryophila]MBB4679505.1 Flp pilus assembly protein TadB [Crossiella cryophila]
MNALIVGVCAGLAVTLLVLAIAPPAPLNIAAAMARAQTLQDSPQDRTTHGTRRPSWSARALAGLAERSARTTNRWWGVPVVDLELLERTVTGYVAARVAWAALGGFTAIVLGVAVELDIATITLLTAVGTVTASLIPGARITRDATAARAEFTRTLASYLELVAQERAAGAAAAQALGEAASLGSGWVIGQIRAVLYRARLTGIPAWDALAQWGQRFRVPAVVELADILATAAEGAAVYTTLTAKAAVLRHATLAADREEANRRSEHLVGPLACLLIAFMIIIIYPLFARL